TSVGNISAPPSGCDRPGNRWQRPPVFGPHEARNLVSKRNRSIQVRDQPFRILDPLRPEQRVRLAQCQDDREGFVVEEQPLHQPRIQELVRKGLVRTRDMKPMVEFIGLKLQSSAAEELEKTDEGSS